jgi:hypothetical protein
VDGRGFFFGDEADLSLPLSIEVKHAYLNSQYSCMAWCLIKHRDSFAFTSPLFVSYTHLAETLYVCFQGMCYFYPEDGGNMFL